MKSAFPCSHVLLIETNAEPRFIELTGAVYSLGRCPSNDILLPGNRISRKHAMLIRVPSLDNNRHCYRLFDGDRSGKFSTNGIKINKIACRETILNHMDSIEFGGAIQAYYYMPQDVLVSRQELYEAKYSLAYQEKSDQINDRQTVVLPALCINSNTKQQGIVNDLIDPWNMPYGYNDITQ